MMSSPVIQLSAEESIKKAADLMTRYNINVLLVMDQTGALKGTSPGRSWKRRCFSVSRT